MYFFLGSLEKIVKDLGINQNITDPSTSQNEMINFDFTHQEFAQSQAIPPQKKFIREVVVNTKTTFELNENNFRPIKLEFLWD